MGPVTVDPLGLPRATASTAVVTATVAGLAGANQDHAVVTARAVAVLDGATSWLPQDPDRDGGWYARALGGALAVRLDGARALTEIVAEAIGEVRDRYGLTAGDSPSSTLTIARWDDADVELCLLGDSPAVVYRPDADPLVVLDERLEQVGADLRAAFRQRLRAGHGYDAGHDRLISQLQLAERAERNRPEGFWIAEADPAAAVHAVTARFPRARVVAVLLVTDGLSADVTDYRRHTWTDVRDLLTRSDPAGYLRDVQDAEDADQDGTWWPRPKRHDDKTVALVSFRADR
jgi:hypothetical protein